MKKDKWRGESLTATMMQKTIRKLRTPRDFEKEGRGRKEQERLFNEYIDYMFVLLNENTV